MLVKEFKIGKLRHLNILGKSDEIIQKYNKSIESETYNNSYKNIFEQANQALYQLFYDAGHLKHQFQVLWFKKKPSKSLKLKKKFQILKPLEKFISLSFKTIAGEAGLVDEQVQELDEKLSKFDNWVWF